MVSASQHLDVSIIARLRSSGGPGNTIMSRSEVSYYQVQNRLIGYGLLNHSFHPVFIPQSEEVYGVIISMECRFILLEPNASLGFYESIQHSAFRTDRNVEHRLHHISKA